MNILFYGLLIEAGTYTISATKSIEDDNFTVSLFDGTSYYDSNSTFTLTEPKTINVYVQIRKTSTSTYTNANIKKDLGVLDYEKITAYS